MMGSAVRGVVVWANLIVSTLIMAPMVVIAGAIGYRRQWFYDWVAAFWSRWNLSVAGATLQAEGLENIELESPQILVGNHQSWFDVFSLAAVSPKTYHFVAKKELEGIFIFGRAWKTAGHISIDRADRASAIRSLDQAGRQLRQERSSVIVFAEGTRSPTDDLLPFKKGAFMLALHTGVPIVPFGIAGSRRAFPKGSWRVWKGPIIVRFGPPIPTEGLGPDDRDALVQRVRDEVRRLRDEARRELGPGRLENVDTTP